MLNTGFNYMAVANLPKKDSALITASYSLNIAERRLILLAITVAKEYLHRTGKHSLLGERIEVSTQRYIEMFGASDQSAYRLLQSTCKSLFKRQFSYTELGEGTGLWHRTSHWVIDIAYMNEIETVAFSFTPAVIASIDELEQHFASLASSSAQKVANLTNAHTIRLYQLLTALHRKSNNPRVSIDDLRKELGILEHEYKRMFDFKRQVLDYSMKQINEHTDIKISYEQYRKVRNIAGFIFKIETKKNG